MMTGSLDERMGRLEQRLEGIDKKLDVLVRLEERQLNHDESLRRAFRRVELVEERLRNMEIKTSRQGVKTSSNEWVVRTLIGVFVSMAASLVVWHLKP